MRIIAIILILCAAGFAQEIRRPTADVNSLSLAIGCTAINTVSSSMPFGWDGAGLTTQSTQTISGNTTSALFKARVFKTWQTTTNTYTGLILNVNVSSLGYLNDSQGGTGNACAAYSIDNGTTWTSLVCDSGGTGYPQHTYTATLSASQDLTRLQVGVCVQGSRQFGSGSELTVGADDISVFDIWTSGTMGAPPAPPPGAPPAQSQGQPHRSAVIVN